eukprot:5735718-Pyramimonas_sp.AAC.1
MAASIPKNQGRVWWIYARVCGHIWRVGVLGADAAGTTSNDQHLMLVSPQGGAERKWRGRGYGCATSIFKFQRSPYRARPSDPGKHRSVIHALPLCK